VSFSLQWDGHDVMWTWEGAGTWLPLKSAQFPNFRDLFARAVPEEIREYSPPFLGALQEPGLVQLWTGIVARTAPGWSLLVRAPVNVPRSGTYELFEGIIETDRWFGPLITNMRLTKTDVPIDFRADFPLVQVSRCHARHTTKQRSITTGWSPTWTCWPPRIGTTTTTPSSALTPRTCAPAASMRLLRASGVPLRTVMRQEDDELTDLTPGITYS